MNCLESLLVPCESVNDTALVVVRLPVENGAAVRAGELVAELEGSKTVIEVHAQCAGYFHALYPVGSSVTVGKPWALVVDAYDAEHVLLQPPTAPAVASTGEQTISRKAAVLMAEHGLTAQDFSGLAVVREADVEALIAQRQGAPTLDAMRAMIRTLSVPDNAVILYGAGLQCVVVTDTLRDSKQWTPVIVVDTQPKTAEVCGLPIVSAASLEDIFAAGIRRAHVCIGNYRAKREVAEKLAAAGFEIVNVLHRSAVVASSAVLGRGIFVGPFVLIGPEAQIGDYCQINNAATIAHHCRLEPGVMVSDAAHIGGTVTIGEAALLGIGVTVNRDLTIGARSTIISGIPIYTHVPEDVVVKQSGVHVAAVSMRR